MNTLKLFSTLSLLLIAQQVAAVSFNVSYTRNYYEVQQGDSFTDLLAAHHEGEIIGTNTLAGFDGLTTTSQISGSARNHSIMMMTSFTVADDTQYEFQVGADWGRGGGIAIYNGQNDIVSEQVFAEDIWWGKSWSNPDVISTDFNFTEGDWNIVWLGFEGCCSGTTSVRFSENGGDFMALTVEDFYPGLNRINGQNLSPVPVPASVWMFCSALIGLFGVKRKG